MTDAGLKFREPRDYTPEGSEDSEDSEDSDDSDDTDDAIRIHYIARNLPEDSEDSEDSDDSEDPEDSEDSDKSRDFRIKEAKKRLGWPETKEISAGAARNLANLSRFLESIPEIKPKTQNQNPIRDTGQVTMLTATGSNSRSSDNSQESF